MHWDHLFEDLEGQLASEWEAERAALDAESERLRISRLDLRSRLRMLCAARASATIDLANGRRLRGSMHVLGSDWVAVTPTTPGVPAATTTHILPLNAITGISTDHGLVLRSLEDAPDTASTLRERMMLGFVLRDLARRRIPVLISMLVGDDVHGTIDRAGADHLDLALHDVGDSRRADAVHGFRIIPFPSIVSVRTSDDQMR